MDSQHESNSMGIDENVVDRVFLRLHGFYGNSFIDKFRIGESRGGKDIGVENAKRIWLSELRAFNVSEVLGALQRIRDAASPFPPGLPEFLAACRASRRPVVFHDPARALPPAGGLRALERLTAARGRSLSRPSGGLATLFGCIASAVSAAGGDEVQALRRLEADVFPRKGQT